MSSARKAPCTTRVARGEAGQAALLFLGVLAALLAGTLVLFGFGQALGTRGKRQRSAAGLSAGFSFDRGSVRTASVGAALDRRLAAIEPWRAELHRSEDRLRAVILASPRAIGRREQQHGRR